MSISWTWIITGTILFAVGVASRYGPAWTPLAATQTLVLLGLPLGLRPRHVLALTVIADALLAAIPLLAR